MLARSQELESGLRREEEGKRIRVGKREERGGSSVPTGVLTLLLPVASP